MNKINWKQKLASRKFGVTIATFVGALLVVFGVPKLTIEHVTAMVVAGAAVIAYIFGESSIDKARIESDTAKALESINNPQNSLKEDKGE